MYHLLNAINAFSADFCSFSLSVLARSFMGAVAGAVRWIARDRQLGGRDASGQVDLKSQHELASSMVCVLCLVSCPYQSLALLCRLCFCDIHKFCFSSLSPLSASLAAHNTVFQSCLSKVRSGQETCYASVFKIHGYLDRSSERAGQPLLKFRENVGCTGQ